MNHHPRPHRPLAHSHSLPLSACEFQDYAACETVNETGNPVAYSARLGLAFPPEVLRATAARMSALNASASTSSLSWMSIARLAFPSRLALKSWAGSCN